MAYSRGEKLDLTAKISFNAIDINIDELFKNSLQEAINDCPNGACCQVTFETSRGTGWEIAVVEIVECPTEQETLVGSGGGGGGGLTSPDASTGTTTISTTYGGSSTGYTDTVENFNCIATSDGECIESMTTLTITEDLDENEVIVLMKLIELNQLINLTPTQNNWFLDYGNTILIDAAFNFLSTGVNEEKQRFTFSIINAHINRDFTGVYNTIDQGGYGKLNAAEKKVIHSNAQYPFKCFWLYKNKGKAENAEVAIYGGNYRNTVSDAFRHAYFNALNARDAGKIFTKLMADAHESEVPIELILEKEMDIFNNDVGIEVGDENTESSDAVILNIILNKVSNGELRYLSPLDYTNPSHIANFGINSETRLTPTNL